MMHLSAYLDTVIRDQYHKRDHGELGMVGMAGMVRMDDTHNHHREEDRSFPYFSGLEIISWA